MKNRNLLLLALLFIGLSPAFAQTQPDLTGTWIFDVDTDMGSGSPTFVLKQDVEGKLTGTYQGQLGSSALTGTLKGDVVHVEFTVQGNLVEYDGKVENDALSGKVKIGTMATGTFTGKRKEKEQ